METPVPTKSHEIYFQITKTNLCLELIERSILACVSNKQNCLRIYVRRFYVNFFNTLAILNYIIILYLMQYVNNSKCNIASLSHEINAVSNLGFSIIFRRQTKCVFLAYKTSAIILYD